MKKGKVLSKSQIALVAMVLMLGAAVWLNSKYSSAGTRYMGEATFVSGEAQQSAQNVAAQVQTDYFTTALSDREKAYKDAEEIITETLKNQNLTENDKKAATEKLAELSSRKVSETAAENLLKAKGFTKTVVTISDSGVTVVVASSGLTAGDTLQIQDAVTSLCGVSLNNIKIVTIEG